ncbi:hypothetical protein PH344_24200 [Escherichia coli]|uniref:hypothetical protein n=1 Tax=Escherichia coli TaxID=562 RepID=UPI0022E90EBE|nr:hypothetical protein [Escherichia coli]MDA2800258.1 hypothetical protein [Escherichia coli]MDA5235459.1 hypothetical protein [Escherichia coli]MDA5374212.1 hypothetical protein [Escherichia coli]
MSAEQDAGKSGKKLAALLGLSSIILFGGSYIAFSKVSGSNCHERCNSDPHPTPEIRSRG